MMKLPHYTHARVREAICFFVLEILLELIIYLFITKLIIICKSLQIVVARGGVEPLTYEFSVRFKPLLLNYIGEYELLLAVELQSIKVKSIIIE